ncbi:MAG: hypothetical protein ABI779_23040 [Acidobacteriota bacterium]
MSALVLRTFALFAAAAILCCQLLALQGLAARPLHYDENEAMHASWLMAAGKTIYRDFFEDHPPHLALLLESVRPEGDLRRTDVQLWTVRARLLAGACGVIAVGALMLLAWRMTGSYSAPIVVAATLLASSQIWARGLADIRAEAPTLALFWVGVLLLLWDRENTLGRAYRAGLGIGLLFFAAVWNPKWPLESLLMGGLYLHVLWTMRARRRWLLAAVTPPIVLAGIALLPLFTVTNVADYLFFNFRFKAAVVSDFTANAWIVDFFRRAPVWQTASPQHRWFWIVAAMVVAAVGTRVAMPAERRTQWMALALCLSALLEFRFVYPYPYLWAQYLVMVATSASLVYALLPAAVESWVARLPNGALLRPSVAILFIVTATAFTVVALRGKAMSAFRAAPAGWTAYWDGQRRLQASLGPADTVWISPPRHPVAAFDASYYWYNFRESVPSAIREHARYPQFLPTVRFADLPPCQTGLAEHARFLELGDWMPFLDGVCSCAEGAFRAGALTPTRALAIFEVGRSAPPEPEGEAWLRRTRWLWSDLCRRQQIFLQGGQLNINP